MKIIQKKEENLFTCPCCGYKTLKDESPGSFYICRVCQWTDDNLQSDDPDYVEENGTPNDVSLRKAQRNFYKVPDDKKLTFENLIKPGEVRWYDHDENWKPLDEER